jgi:hypothetical protein
LTLTGVFDRTDPTAVIALLASVVAVTTPAREAPDEPDHAQNAQTLASGHWYRMERGARNEAHQAPLYDLGLAGWQRIWGVSVRKPPTRDPLPFSFHHAASIGARSRDSADHRFVLVLRVSRILLGAVTVLLAAATVRHLSDDPMDAGGSCRRRCRGSQVRLSLRRRERRQPRQHTRSTAHALARVDCPALSRQRSRGLLAAGDVLGLLVLAKASTIPLAFAVMIAIVATRSSWRERESMLAVAAGSTLAACGSWLVQNQVRYGDPLAHRASTHYPSEHLDGAPWR